MIYEGILGPHEGFQTLQKEPSDFPEVKPALQNSLLLSREQTSIVLAPAIDFLGF